MIGGGKKQNIFYQRQRSPQWKRSRSPLNKERVMELGVEKYKQQVEIKFKSSIANQTYRFGNRNGQISPDSSLETLHHITSYNLNNQNIPNRQVLSKIQKNILENDKKKNIIYSHIRVKTESDMNEDNQYFSGKNNKQNYFEKKQVLPQHRQLKTAMSPLSTKTNIGRVQTQASKSNSPQPFKIDGYRFNQTKTQHFPRYEVQGHIKSPNRIVPVERTKTQNSNNQQRQTAYYSPIENRVNSPGKTFQKIFTSNNFYVQNRQQFNFVRQSPNKINPKVQITKTNIKPISYQDKLQTLLTKSKQIKF